MSTYYATCPHCKHKFTEKGELPGVKFIACPKCKEEVPVIRNWMGMPYHPTDSYLFFKDKEDTVKKFRQLWDGLIEAGGNAKDLEELIDMARSNAVTDHEFNSSESA